MKSHYPSLQWRLKWMWRGLICDPRTRFTLSLFRLVWLAYSMVEWPYDPYHKASVSSSVKWPLRSLPGLNLCDLLTKSLIWLSYLLDFWEISIKMPWIWRIQTSLRLLTDCYSAVAAVLLGREVGVLQKEDSVVFAVLWKNSGFNQAITWIGDSWGKPVLIDWKWGIYLSSCLSSDPHN